jgi:formate C-acetyltransferase
MIKVFSGRPGGGFTDHRSADNTFSIGGYTESGKDGFNEVSKLIIEALVELPTWRPQANVRFTKETPFEVYRYVTEMNYRQSNVVFTNDEVRIPAYIKLGMTKEDAINYTMVGCNEWTAMGKGHTGSQGFFNPLHALEKIMASKELSTFNTFDEFYVAYENQLAKDVSVMMDMADDYFKEACKDVNVITSIFIDDCIEKATPITAGGARYSVSNWSCNGFSNVIDSLSVIKQFVFEQKKITLIELAKALSQNWEGYEELRNEILNKGEFWGNNNGADLLASRFISTLERLCETRRPLKGGVFRFGSYTGYNSSNVSMGKMTGATPDGRFKGDCLCPAMNAGVNKMKNGLTAYLASVAKNDYSFLIGPLATNIMLDSSLANSPEKLDKLATLFKTFLDMGGMQLQPTYLSADELEKAQIKPEEYQDLRVRVTGFSATFTKLDKGVQDEVISRQRVKNA